MKARVVLVAGVALAIAASACAALLGAGGAEYAAPDAASADAASADGAAPLDAGAGDSGVDADGGGPTGDACTASACGACALPRGAGPSCYAGTGGCLQTALVDAGASDAGALATYPFGMAVDATEVYWVAQSNRDGNDAGVVLRAPKAGGPPETLAVDPDWPITVALDATYMYWFSRNPLRVRRVPKAALPCGACAQAEDVLGPLPTEGGGQTDGAGLAILGPDDVAVLTNAQLYHALKANGAWATARAGDMVIGNGSHMARTPNGLFVLSTDSVTSQRTVAAFDLGFALVAQRLTPPNDAGVGFVVGDCTNAWAGGPDAVWRLDDPPVSAWTPHPVDGGTSYSSPTWAMGIDQSFFYVGGPDGHGLWRVARDGSRGPELVTDGDVWGLVVDDDAIYWGEHGSVGPAGTIYRIDKSH